MKYLCIKNGENKGVYQSTTDIEWKELNKMLKKGISSRVFKENEKEAALKWTGVKEVANRQQTVVEEKKGEINCEFSNLMNLTKSIDTVFAKITLTDGSNLIIPIKEFCLFECLSDFINFSTISKRLKNNEYEVYMERVSIQNRNNILDIKTLFHKKYTETIQKYQNLEKSNWRHDKYIVPNELELFKQTLKIVKDSIIKNYCIFNYDFHSSVQYNEHNQFIFIKNIVKEFNMTQNNYSNNHLHLSYKSMIININEIVKIEPYINLQLQQFIITDKEYISVLKEFKENLKEEK